jgi:hypothetical protein
MIQCPEGDYKGKRYIKLRREAYTESCARLGIPCYPHVECICSPCRAVPQERYAVFATPGVPKELDIIWLFRDTLSRLGLDAFFAITSMIYVPEPSVKFYNCTKAAACLTVPLRKNVTFIVIDLMEPLLMDLLLEPTASLELMASSTLKDEWKAMMKYDMMTW